MQREKIKTYMHTIIISGTTETCETSEKSNWLFGIGDGET